MVVASRRSFESQAVSVGMRYIYVWHMLRTVRAASTGLEVFVTAAKNYPRCGSITATANPPCQPPLFALVGSELCLAMIARNVQT
jgi:hypothetical protein